jgi:hypothetical protein
VAFTKAKPTAFADGAGGIGTVADGTFPTVKDLQTVLVAINAALDRHRGWTKTLGGSRGLGFGTGTTNVLQSEGVGVAAWLGGTWFLQGISGYTVTTGTNLNAGVGPYVLGEASGGEDGLDRTAIVLDANTDPNEVLMGKWQRVSFDQDGSLTGGFRIGGNLILENVKFTPGLVAITDISSGDPHGLSGKQVNIDGATQRDRAGALVIGDQTSNGVYFATLEDSRIESPDDANCDATLYLFHTAGTGVDHPNQKHVFFRNCAFVASGSHPLISDIDSPSPTIADLVFDGCLFRSTEAVAIASAFFEMLQTSRVTFRNCVFHDRMAAGFKNVGATFIDCRFFIGADSAPVDRTLIDMTSCKLTNCEMTFVNIGSTGAPIAATFEDCTIKGLAILLSTAEETLPLSNRGFVFDGCKIDDLQLDFNDANLASGGANREAAYFVNCKATNVTLLRAGNGRDGGNNSTCAYVTFEASLVTNVELEMGVAAKTDAYANALLLNNSKVTNLIANNPGSSTNFVEAGIMISGGSKVNTLVISGPFMDGANDVAGVRIDGNRSQLSHLHYGETTGAAGNRIVMISGVDCSLEHSTVVGGNRAGTWLAQLILVTGNRNMISNNHLEYSPSSNAAGNEAVSITGDNNNFTDNIVAKDLSVVAAGTTNYLADTGSGNIDDNTNFSEATL